MEQIFLFSFKSLHLQPIFFLNKAQKDAEYYFNLNKEILREDFHLICMCDIKKHQT